MNDVLRIAHLRIAHQGAILRWAILTFTDKLVLERTEELNVKLSLEEIGWVLEDLCQHSL